MNETKHSPGPWRVSSTDIAIPSGATVEVEPTPEMFDITILATSREGRMIAIADERGYKLNPGDYLDTGESLANMRLIAAAPDLLTICEKIALWTCTDETKEGGGFDFFAEELVPELFAAIAAAKGEA